MKQVRDMLVGLLAVMSIISVEAITITGDGISAKFDDSTGALVSLKGADGVERVLAANELFSLSLLDAAGNEQILNSSDFAFRNEGDSFIYTRDGLEVVVNLATVRDELRARVAVKGIPAGRRLNWVDAPQVWIAEQSKLYWPIYDGCEVSDFRLYERDGGRRFSDGPVGFPRRGKTEAPLYPGMATMQFMAAYQNGHGLYFAAHDCRHTQKGLRWKLVEHGKVKLSLQTFCGDGQKDGQWAGNFDFILRPYAGDWMQACAIYRDFVSALPEFKLPVKRPQWLKESPIVICYPVRGDGKDNEPLDMAANCYFPYVNAIEDIEHYQKYFGVNILALLMHWEGTAPWAPPYVWPPFGGEKKLAEYRDRLHAKGNRLGLYCSGTAWTQVSSIVPSYSRTMQYTNEHLDRVMMRGPKGEIDAKNCNHPRAQRLGYDMCLMEDWCRKTVLKEIKAMRDFGVDYCQFFDQNMGGGPNLCWSAEHNHPAVPGAWMTAAMKTLQDEAVQGEMVIGCEGAAAHPFVNNLYFNDARSFVPVSFGRPVPGLAFVFHEWSSNFSGNGCCQSKSEAFRLAYSFHNGDMLTLVLADKGHIVSAWTVSWKEYLSEERQNLVLRLTKEFNDLRRKYPEFLFNGRMIAPLVEVIAPEAEVDLGAWGGTRYFRYPAALSSFWQAADGRKIGFVTNYGKEPLEITLKWLDGTVEKRQLAAYETIELEVGREEIRN